MTGNALVCKLQNISPIEEADRIVRADMFGETIITQKSNQEGMIGLLFDCETQLSNEFCKANNLYRHEHLNADTSVKGYFDDNRRVRPIRLKGVKCSAMWIPLNSLDFISGIGVAYASLREGEEISEFAGVPICKKYVNPHTLRAMNNNGKQGKAREAIVPTFKEHFDTDQLLRNMHQLRNNDVVIVTEKIHGTSCRCGYLPKVRKQSNFFHRLFGVEPKGEYLFTVGSQRVVKYAGDTMEGKKHYYDSDLWTAVSREQFEGKLHKGETVYFEIVGHTPEGGTIMPGHSTEKLKNFLSKEEYKKAVDRYGDVVDFNYGTNTDGESYKVFVYRITLSNEDGETIDYSWDQVKTRCEQLNVPYTPEIARMIINKNVRIHTDKGEVDVDQRSVQNYLQGLTECYSDTYPDKMKEGICVRIENGRMVPTILKNKSYTFKVLEGIIKDSEVVDLEEIS